MQASRTLSSFLAAASLTLVSTVANADDKRAPQDYGVPEEGTTVGDMAVWPPRVVLFPLWLLTEFVVRRPTGAVVQSAEKGQWIQNAQDLLTFGRRGAPLGEIAIFPSALLDFGLKPSVGFNAQWNYIVADENSIALHFGTWGPDWIAARIADSYALSKTEKVFIEGTLVRRRDNPFSGVGPLSRQGARSRYSSTISQVAIGHEKRFWRSSFIRSQAGSRTLFFGDTGCCDEPSLEQEVAAGRLFAPGYGQGYAGAFQRVDFELDSREALPAPGSGLRVELHEESVYTLDPNPGQERRAWVKYGGSVGAALDLTKQQRVISAAVAAELVDPLAGSVPFPDQVTLGGDNLMPGFLRSRLVDRSSVVGSLQYRWPIWVFLDGVIHAAAGNVFGARFAGFDVKQTRLSSGIGVRSNGARESGFELLFAVGSEPFNDQFKVDSVRLVLGTHHGF